MFSRRAGVDGLRLELELAVERDDVIGGCAASGIRLGKDRPV